MAYDLKKLCQTHIIVSIDQSIVSGILAKPPFIELPGSFNARRLPLLHCNVYRTGSLEALTMDGISSIKALGITKVFDLRSLKERTSSPFPEITGIEIFWLPSTLDNPTVVPTQLSSNNKPDSEDPTAYFIDTYLSILTSHAAVIRAMLYYILTSNTQDAFSFNCTAGKDRTGVVAYILLRLAGIPLEEIDLDYALTRIGIEPIREFLTKKVNGGRPLDMKDPRMQVAASIPFNAMTLLDEAVREKYGKEGVRAYVKGQLRIQADELEEIVNKLRR